MTRVYLAGPVDPTCLSACLNWRREAATQLATHGIESRDPTRGGQHPQPSDSGELKGFPVSAKQLVTRDKADIRGSDVLLVVWPAQSQKRGIGTIMEIALAGEWSIPVLLVDPAGHLHGHPWIEVYVTQQHDGLSAAVAAIADYWRGPAG
jgi:hypothetical protein